MSTPPVFLAPGLAGVAERGPVMIEGDEARHAVVVRRIRVGEQIMLTDGAGTAAVCTVTSAMKSKLTALVDTVSLTPREAPRVSVVQAIPKGDRAELAVEVLTEIGVDVIVPWAAARCVGVWRGERAAKSLARWRSTSREAAKQSRRSWFPEVTELASTTDVVRLLRSADLAVVLHEAATSTLADLPVAGAPEDSAIVLVVGPEGGISDEEITVFAGADAAVVRLGSTVLRTSTAGVAGVAALLARTPRWS